MAKATLSVRRFCGMPIMEHESACASNEGKGNNMTHERIRHVGALGLLLVACSTGAIREPTVDAAPGGSDTGAHPTTPTSDCWQSASIPDISSWDKAGAEYPAPTVAGTCSGDFFVVTSNGIPTFPFVPLTPNGLSAKAYSFALPRHPRAAPTTSAIPLGGTVAVTVTGLPIFGPTENPRDGYRDPYLDDTIMNLLDDCNGHTAPGGTYHIHARPSCIIAKLGGDAKGLVVGWAADGYPILAPVVCADDACTSSKRVRSSWKRNLDEYTKETRGPAWSIHSYVEGLGDLDRCNGLPITDPDVPYDYAYFVTDTFPYFMGCYHGTPVAMR
jgi:hypothetical protein